MVSRRTGSNTAGRERFAPDPRAAYGAYFGQLAIAGLAAGAIAITLGLLAARRPRAS